MEGAQILLRTFVIVAGLEGFVHPAPASREVYRSEPNLLTLDFNTEFRAMLSLLLLPGYD